MSVQYCTRKTAAQMKEESRKATEEGMRAIAQALTRKKRSYAEISSDSDSESESGSDNEGSSRVKALETRIHYLKLDLANMTVDRDTFKNQAEAFATKFNIYGAIHEALRDLGEIRERMLKAQKSSACRADLLYQIQIYRAQVSYGVGSSLALVQKAPHSELMCVIHGAILNERNTLQKELVILERVALYRGIFEAIQILSLWLLIALGLGMLGSVAMDIVART